MVTTYREVEEALVAQIQALDPSAHQQGGSADVWHESRVPLSIVDDPSNLGHLAFNVWIEAAPNSGLHRDAELAGEIYVVAGLVVAFAYRLRAGNQVADARAATDAAHDVVRALMAPDAAGSADVAYVDGLQPAMADDGEWLFVTQTYEVRFDLDLSRSS